MIHRALEQTLLPNASPAANSLPLETVLNALALLRHELIASSYPACCRSDPEKVRSWGLAYLSRYPEVLLHLSRRNVGLSLAPS